MFVPLFVASLYGAAFGLGAILHALGWLSLFGCSLVALLAPWAVWPWVWYRYLLSRSESRRALCHSSVNQYACTRPTCSAGEGYPGWKDEVLAPPPGPPTRKSKAVRP